MQSRFSDDEAAGEGVQNLVTLGYRDGTVADKGMHASMHVPPPHRE